MATTWLSLLLVAAVSLHLHGSSTAPKHILVQAQSPDGVEVFAKDVRGRAVKAIFFGPESPVSVVTLSTDGRSALIKSEYDHRGHLIDCDLIEHRADIQRFGHHVEESIEKETLKAAGGKHVQQSERPVAFVHDPFNLDAQAHACEQLLAKRQDEDEPATRKKRSYLLWPGTNWCGKGSKAEFAENFGPNKATDQCCQKHDQCPYVIEGLSTRYNLFNYRIHTLSHCDCDVPFLECLKSANTSTSSMVGKVYFNVVNTECFELSLQKTCTRRSWWGGCEKYTTKWTANIKTLGNFPE